MHTKHRLPESARVNIEYCLGTMRLLNHSSLDYQSSKRWELLPSSGLWVSRQSGLGKMSFLKSHSIQRALFKSCTWPLHNFSELNFAFLLCEFSSTCLGLTFGVPMLMFFTTKVDNKDPERRWKMYNCQVFLEIDKKWHFLWCHITPTLSQLFRTRCVSEWPDTVNFQSHLEYRQDYIVIVVVCMVMLMVLMVMVVDCGQGHLEYKQDYKLIVAGVSGNSRLPYKFVGISHEFIK